MSQSLARRTFLKGAGLTVALPMLEAVVASTARSASSGGVGADKLSPDKSLALTCLAASRER